MSTSRVSAAALAFGLLALAPAAHAQRNAGGYPEATGVPAGLRGDMSISLGRSSESFG